MARAKRHYLPGQVWHITHRCHKREFLLKFTRDRRRWIELLLEAKRRYGLVVLNYMVTSNHIHLLVYDCSGREVIPRSMQLVAGRSAQEYNDRKRRRGAFWQDRYHATAVEQGEHLLRCIVYLDLNMVRAGVVNHPSAWRFSGYHEIQEPRRKCALLAYDRLEELAGFTSYNGLRAAHREWLEAALRDGGCVREGKWTESIAVGSEEFAGRIKEGLGVRAKGREVIAAADVFHLREPGAWYGDDSCPENDDIGPENEYLRSVFCERSGG